MKRLLMGNEAIALGAIRAGLRFASGYPGTPSSEIMETVARERPEGVYAEWSVNEKTALEAAAGAAMAGARAMVTMKQVGLNVASDPLMSLNYVGVRAGMVVVVADDPGPISSQTEQDTRHFGMFAKIPVFDPCSPEEAYRMAGDAFLCSERIGRPVLLRSTTRVCHSYATVELLDPLPAREPEGFDKGGGRWVIFPRLSYANHIRIEEGLAALAGEFAGYEGNALRRETGSVKQTPGCFATTSCVKQTPGCFATTPFEKGAKGAIGVAAGGVGWLYVNEAMRALEKEGDAENHPVGCADTPPQEGNTMGCANVRLLKVGTVPLPQPLCLEFLEGLDEVLVVEELDPVIERELTRLCGTHGLRARIRGKGTGDMPVAGEYTPQLVAGAIRKFLGGGAETAAQGQVQGQERTKQEAQEHSEQQRRQQQAVTQTGQVRQAQPAQGPEEAQQTQPLPTPQTSQPPQTLPVPQPPMRPPVLCAGCPHRASFFAVKEVARGKKAVFCGDIGCYTLGNAQPLDMVDTCLCMGAGIAQAQGLNRVEPDAQNFAFIGDSTFFHTGLPGIVNAVFNRANIIVAVLDNRTTAMTGGQANPGMGKNLLGEAALKLSIYDIISAMGVDDIQRVNAFDLEASKAAAARAMQKTGVRVILFEGACINVAPKGAPLAVDAAACKACGACARKLGCPAISLAPKAEGGVARIDSILCTGCGLCAQVCPFGAIGAGKPPAANAATPFEKGAKIDANPATPTTPAAAQPPLQRRGMEGNDGNAVADGAKGGAAV